MWRGFITIHELFDARTSCLHARPLILVCLGRKFASTSVRESKPRSPLKGWNFDAAGTLIVETPQSGKLLIRSTLAGSRPCAAETACGGIAQFGAGPPRDRRAGWVRLSAWEKDVAAVPYSVPHTIVTKPKPPFARNMRMAIATSACSIRQRSIRRSGWGRHGHGRSVTCPCLRTRADRQGAGARPGGRDRHALWCPRAPSRAA